MLDQFDSPSPAVAYRTPRMTDQNAGTPSPPAPAKPPRCAMCRARMELQQSVPDQGGGDRCTFACPKCEFVKIKIIGGPPDLSRHRPPKRSNKQNDTRKPARAPR
jgi:hypothetical protein